MNRLWLLLTAAAAMVGCRQDMQDQPKYRPLAYSTFFADGRSARPVPAGVIAVDDPIEDTPELTGLSDGQFVATIPVPVTDQSLHRGRQRFEIYCAPCHGRVGDGNGMIAQRGFLAPMNLQSARVVNAPPGYLFGVISNGYGAMGRYDDQVDVADRWAIIAYIRALELSQSAKVDDVPPDQRAALEQHQ
jgi:mono/diheme cytochrome c family protein